MVMGGDSRSKGHGLESQHCILDGHFSHLFVVKLLCLFERKYIKKRPGMAHFIIQYDYTWSATANGL